MLALQECFRMLVHMNLQTSEATPLINSADFGINVIRLIERLSPEGSAAIQSRATTATQRLTTSQLRSRLHACRTSVVVSRYRRASPVRCDSSPSVAVDPFIAAQVLITLNLS